MPKLILKDQNTAEVNLKNSEDGISPGQACVFYNKDKNGYKVLVGVGLKLIFFPHKECKQIKSYYT